MYTLAIQCRFELRIQPNLRPRPTSALQICRTFSRNPKQASRVMNVATEEKNTQPQIKSSGLVITVEFPSLMRTPYN